MKAIVYTQYGPPDVLQLKEVPQPIPKDNEVLIKVHAAALNAADLHLLRADPWVARFYSGLFKPTKYPILGADVAGVVEAVGKSVTQFKAGDEVFADVFKAGFGALAEYVCAHEQAFVLKPVNLSFEEAAAVPLAALTALHGLRDVGKLKPGEKVLVNGSSGGVGTFTVQVAKYFGAEVTAVCSTRNVEQSRALGADHVIDYTKEDFTKSGQRYDLIFAANGFHPLSAYKQALNPGGRYVMAGGTNAQMSQAIFYGPLLSMFGSRKMGMVSSKPNQKDLTFMKELIEAGKVKPVIARRYPLAETVEAFRYLDEGHAQGKIVITMM
jgi:2-desacetyl-2-hydroxyethyl bacteriochlorophyllide A dehydrogenase